MTTFEDDLFSRRWCHRGGENRKKDELLMEERASRRSCVQTGPVARPAGPFRKKCCDKLPSGRFFAPKWCAAVG